MFWLRIDNRLVHGQIVETWLPYLRSRYVIVIDDAVAHDSFRQQIIKLALPSRIGVSFTSLGELRPLLEKIEDKQHDILCLVENCLDAKRVVELGVAIETVNIGNIHYSGNCYQLSNSIAATADDLACFQYFEEQGITLDFRCVPSDASEVKKIW